MAARWLILGLALVCLAPQSVTAQSTLRGPDRRVLRATLGTPVSDQLHYGLEADFGITGWGSIVTSVRRWRYDGYGCIWPGPIKDEPVLSNVYPPCTPDGWAFSGGLRGALSVLFAEADLGLYRYDHNQVLVAPFGGVRAGLAPSIGSAVELQLALHLILVSSYNRGGFDPDTWFLGSWDLGVGVRLP